MTDQTKSPMGFELYGGTPKETKYYHAVNELIHYLRETVVKQLQSAYEMGRYEEKSGMPENSNRYNEKSLDMFIESINY